MKTVSWTAMFLLIGLALVLALILIAVCLWWVSQRYMHVRRAEMHQQAVNSAHAHANDAQAQRAFDQKRKRVLLSCSPYPSLALPAVVRLERDTQPSRVRLYEQLKTLPTPNTPRTSKSQGPNQSGVTGAHGAHGAYGAHGALGALGALGVLGAPSVVQYGPWWLIGQPRTTFDTQQETHNGHVSLYHDGRRLWRGDAERLVDEYGRVDDWGKHVLLWPLHRAFLVCGTGGAVSVYSFSTPATAATAVTATAVGPSLSHPLKRWAVVDLTDRHRGPSELPRWAEWTSDSEVRVWQYARPVDTESAEGSVTCIQRCKWNVTSPCGVWWQVTNGLEQRIDATNQWMAEGQPAEAGGCGHVLLYKKRQAAAVAWQPAHQTKTKLCTSHDGFAWSEAQALTVKGSRRLGRRVKFDSTGLWLLAVEDDRLHVWGHPPFWSRVASYTLSPQETAELNTEWHACSERQAAWWNTAGTVAGLPAECWKHSTSTDT